MTVSLAVIIFICASISGSKVCALSMQHSITSGSKLEITCKVLAELHTTVEILVYWLANHSYIEDYSNSSRVTEIRIERRETEGSYIEVKLSFSEVRKKDFEINFVCVVLSEEMDQERFVFIKPAVSNVASHIVVAVAVLVSVILVSKYTYKFLKSKHPLSYEILK
ncbi:interleukin-1 receptor type 2-like isoform X2 [Heptranchias perlo]|uniref:interleukin-1 receptor type 2-like isoform X2 n=1 Tax=Heptranchias perlo TaxID=212740 RepID=UPI00355A5D0C